MSCITPASAFISSHNQLTIYQSPAHGVDYDD